MTDALEPLPVAYDPDSLHEIAPDLEWAGGRADQLRDAIRDSPEVVGELVARGDLVDLLRIAMRTDEALNEANAAVDRAEIAGTAAQQHVAGLRLAQVHQWRGDFAESNIEITELLRAAREFGPIVEALTHQVAGLNDYDQGHWDDAREHFAHALRIREPLAAPDPADSGEGSEGGGDDDIVRDAELSRISLDAATRRAAET